MIHVVWDDLADVECIPVEMVHAACIHAEIALVTCIPVEMVHVEIVLVEVVLVTYIPVEVVVDNTSVVEVIDILVKEGIDSMMNSVIRVVDAFAVDTVERAAAVMAVVVDDVVAKAVAVMAVVAKAAARAPMKD